jgi:peptidoglycan/LPS O-acetylase OafA/YrhL
MNLSKLFFSRPAHNFKAIDGIRALAILWVIFFHTWIFQYSTFPDLLDGAVQNPWLVWLTKGDLGVDLFFVISGFLIGTILFKEFKKTNTINFKSFYIRRLLRLLPVYVFSMVIAQYFLQGNGADRWDTVWTNLLYINNYVSPSYMGWTWSLAIEEQFYIVIPFLIVFLFPKFRKKRYIFALLAIIPIAFTYYYSVHIFNFQIPFNREVFGDVWGDWFWGYYMLTHLRYGGLLSGVIGAYLHVNYSERVALFFKSRPLQTNFLIIVSLLLFVFISSLSFGQIARVDTSIFYSLPQKVGVYYEIIHRDVFSYAVVFIMMACMYSQSQIIKPINRFLSLNFFYPIAKISYSAYLFHVMFMEWLFPMFKEATSGYLSSWQIIWCNVFISIVVTVVASALMVVFIEEPFNTLKNKISKKKKPIQ